MAAPVVDEADARQEKESSATTKGQTHKPCLARVSASVEAGIARATEALAVRVAARPYATLGLSLVFALVLSLGWLRFRNEDDPQKLYAPQGTRAFRDRDWVEDRFGDGNAASRVYLDAKGRSINLLTKDALAEAFDLHDLVLSIQAEGGERGYDERSCATVFWRADDEDSSLPSCQKESILAFWDYNRTKMLEDPDVVATVNMAKSDCCAPSRRTVTLSAVAAKLRRDDPDRPDLVTGVGSMTMAFYLAQSLNKKSRADPHVERLEHKFDDEMRDWDGVYFERPLPLTGWGIGENQSAAFDWDRIFINLSIVIIVAYAYFALYDRRRPDRSRGLLGLGAVLTVLLSTIAAFGAAMAFGVDFSNSAGVAVFLVMGIGLDDSFVICGAVDDAPPPGNERSDDDDDEKPPLDGVAVKFVEDQVADERDVAGLSDMTGGGVRVEAVAATTEPTELVIEPGEFYAALEDDARRVLQKDGPSVEEVSAQRVVRALKSSGPSILVTSVTDAIAFVAGSFTDTPDIANFSRFCAAAVLVDFVMQVTFFAALLVLDQRARLRRRVASKRRSKEEEEDAVVVDDETAAAATVEKTDEAYHKKESSRLWWQCRCQTNKKRPAAKKSTSTVDPLATWFGGAYARRLTSPIGSVVVLSLTAIALTFAIIGCVRVEMDIESNALVVGGYVEKALDYQGKHYDDSTTAWVGLYTKQFDYLENRDRLKSLLENYASERYVASSDFDSGNWFADYDTWLTENFNATTFPSTESEYVETLRDEYLAGPGKEYSEKVTFSSSSSSSSSSSRIVASEIDTFWVEDGATEADWKRRMRKARKAVRRYDENDALGTVVVYNPGFIWYESFVIIANATIRAMLIACGSVFIVLLLLLGHPFAAVLVSSLVAFVCVCVFGYVYHYNDEVNYISSFFIVIAVGLSTDAPAHVCRAFLDSRRPTRRERAVDALHHLGPSVFRGGLSTILGIAVTGACRTYVFRSFFKYLMTILVLALWNGVAVMPVLLALIGPMPTLS